MSVATEQRVFLSYLLLLGALVAALLLLAEFSLKPQLVAGLDGELRHRLTLGQTLYDASPDLSPDSVADLLGSLTGDRVTLVRADGSVAGDSEVPADALARLETHAARPEIAEARRGGTGRATRVSASLGEAYRYIATPTARGEVLRLAVPLRQVEAAVARTQAAIVIAGLGAVLVAALLTLAFSLAMGRPLRRLARTAKLLAAGDLSQRATVPGDDAVGDLTRAVNALADELQRRLGQLEGERAEMQALIDSMAEGVLAIGADGTIRRSNPAARQLFGITATPGARPETVSRRPPFLELIDSARAGLPVPPTELTADGRSLLATAHPLADGGAVLVFLDISELRRLESVRRDFVANASHELKTPLTAIRGFSETLLDETLPNELRLRFARIVSDNADRLQRIVDDLLDLSRIESGGWRVDPAPVALEDLARDVWQTANSRGEGCGPAFKVALQPEAEIALADEGALRQIFANLFSNAARYTPQDGVVRLTAQLQSRDDSQQPGGGAAAEQPAWIMLEVADTGSGIPSAHLPRIFERFYRGDPARSRQEGGTGLGLAIVRHLVEAHGGRVTAESELGRGTTIRFSLPAAPSL